MSHVDQFMPRQEALEAKLALAKAKRLDAQLCLDAAEKPGDPLGQPPASRLRSRAPLPLGAGEAEVQRGNAALARDRMAALLKEVVGAVRAPEAT